MKLIRNVALLLCLCLVFCLVSCGESVTETNNVMTDETDSAAVSDETEQDAQAAADAAASAAAETADGEESSEDITQAEEPEDMTENESAEEDNGENTNVVPTVSIAVTDGSYSHENGTQLLTVTMVNISISVEGKPEVEESINADLQALLSETSTVNSELKAQVEADYEASLEEDWEWYAYESELTAQVVRCDSQVLSIRFNGYSYSGGAHGYSFSYGRSYDVQSGSRLSLTFLSANGADFPTYALKRVTDMCGTEEYSELLFDTDIIQESLSDVVSDEQFLLTGEGVVFLADPYVIGPYSSGIIEFTLPYDELEGVVKADYLPV
ncbi:MAG: DUF3298 and DUF4163 domain-containing protein [Clostridiales bacterium]|nr:DUF3298 and DUF4163 domain-containing protein [Clostridiales bacterium]